MPEEANMTDSTIVYIGTYTSNNDSKGIYICDLDQATGDLEVLGHGPQVGSPSFLAVHPTKQYLYACNSIGGRGATASAAGESLAR
jgi:6-phosphogluconolactonase